MMLLPYLVWHNGRSICATSAPSTPLASNRAAARFALQHIGPDTVGYAYQHGYGAHDAIARYRVEYAEFIGS